jgi:hypothetical protein
MSRVRWSGAMVAVWAGLGLAVAGPAQDPSPPPSATPIRDSVERVVARMEEQRTDPCLRAIEEGRPCFPVTTTISGPTYSVREGLREALASPAPPPRDEMGPYRPGPKSTVVPLVSFDPGCLGKSIFKKLKGRNDTYYLYRLRDPLGERVELYDRRLEASTFQGEIEQLGKFDGECDAIAAYRRAQLRYAPASPAPVASPSPGASPRPASR